MENFVQASVWYWDAIKEEFLIFSSPEKLIREDIEIERLCPFCNDRLDKTADWCVSTVFWNCKHCKVITHATNIGLLVKDKPLKEVVESLKDVAIRY